MIRQCSLELILRSHTVLLSYKVKSYVTFAQVNILKSSIDNLKIKVITVFTEFKHHYNYFNQMFAVRSLVEYHMGQTL
jgi:hypothetical protein